jgi:hypothetical protein
MISVYPNPNITSHLNELLKMEEEKPKIIEPVQDIMEQEDDESSENQGSEEECEENDADCYTREELKKFAPRKISYLTLQDENKEQKIIKQVPPEIFGSGNSEIYHCVICNTNIRGKRHIAQHNKGLKHQFNVLKMNA